jgi:hypothetical protein
MNVLLLATGALAQPPPDIAGTYRMELLVVSRAHIPVFGEAFIDSTTTTIATIIPDGSGGYTQTHSTCSVVPVSTLELIETIIPQTFVAQIPNKSYPLGIVAQDDGSWSFQADLGEQHIGYDPELTDGTIPDNKDHPAITDWEDDGHPGATINLKVPVFSTVEVYLVQLAHTHLNGSIDQDGNISGNLNIISFEQRSIGARPPMFSANPKATQLAEKSVFSYTRILEGSTCASL